ncbi:hypothetical protein [Mucilaginibacter sp.]|jgi:hypothetical protein|uniref:hypothetical protein n=1 Tax=Mucilaginibacter sp. TaxID=1882438 RepID=UPI002CB9DEB5|nr:hypothetical protein [Mucilaginibacter sp.]HTI61462.1 hypothetical protein [Mucilaginibacter sp.]
MKNPFAKENNGPLIVSVAVGSAIAGAAAYLFLTEDGSNTRRSIADRFAGLFAKKEPVAEHKTDYLKKPHKAPKTDKEELLHHGIINEQPGV